MAEAVLLFLTSVVLVTLAVVGRRQRQARVDAAATVDLVVDTWGVRRGLADGREEAIGWGELESVDLLVLPRGPWPDRRRYVLAGHGERGCLVPESLATPHHLVEHLSALRGFDLRRLADVLDETRPGRYSIWSKAR